MATDMAGRAGVHLLMMTRGEEGTRDERTQKAHEGMRDLEDEDRDRFALQNASIVPADTHKNESYVNDGQGGFRRAASVGEAVAYQEKRMSQVKRKISPKSIEQAEFVVHLPKTLCVEIPNYYPGTVDKKTGKRRGPRSRFVARDEEEAKRYFQDAMEYLTDNVFPGGQASVGWFSMQFDESTPHIQGMADTFDEDPKNPGHLRVSASRAYLTHRDVRYTEGPKKGKQVSGRVKLQRYNEGMREHMRALGWPVEEEVSERAHESFTKERYGEIMDRERDVEDAQDTLAEREVKLKTREDKAKEDQDAAAETRRSATQLTMLAATQFVQLQALKDAAEREKEEVERAKANAKTYASNRRADADDYYRRTTGDANDYYRQMCDEADNTRREAGEKAAELLGDVEGEVIGWVSEEMKEISRDEMRQVDSNFLDKLIAEHPRVKKDYDQYIQENLEDWRVREPVREYLSRSVRENRERRKTSPPPGGGQGGNGQPQGGNGQPQGGGAPKGGGVTKQPTKKNTGDYGE